MISFAYLAVLLLWTTSCQVSAVFRLDNDMDNLRICENIAPGEVIDTLTSIDGTDPIKYWFLNHEDIPFTMVGGTGVPSTNNDGRVELKSEISFEDVETYRVIIIAEDSSPSPLQVTATSTVTVRDANDNAPLFLDTPYIVELLEGTTNGKTVQKVRANDYDNGQDGAVTFSLQPGNDRSDFSISTTSVSEAAFLATITMAVDLDFEASQSHSVTVMAMDGGEKSTDCGTNYSLNSTTNLYLTVRDAPDRPPVFYREFYTAHVEENTNTFKDLSEFIVEARDGDLGLNWDIKYSLEGGGLVFEIDVDTGEILIIGDIDRESSDVENGLFTLTVTATEIKPSDAEDFTGFPGAESTDKAVTIYVDDQDDNFPLFYNSSESLVKVNQFSLTIPEDTQNTVPDFSFNVRDIDRDENARFTLTLLGEHASLFELSTRGGILDADVTLRVVGGLDYETHKSLTFQVVAEGTVNSSKQTIATFEVRLEDVNDNSPVFKTSDVKVTVPEHSEVGTNIINITATDLDSGEYGKVSYALLPSDSFGISADGEVYVKVENLDRERRDVYYLTVRAEDGDGRINTTQLTIALTDINDVKPEFQPSQYLVNWNENDDSVSPVSVYALDGDEVGSDNSLLSLAFQDPLMNANYSINTTLVKLGTITGEIKPLKALNAEEIDGECNSGVIEYSFKIIVYDYGEPQNNGTAEVLVYLRDENDHEPYFEKEAYEGEVAEYSEYDTEIAAILANDDDKCSPNSDITYTVDSEFSQFLVSPNENGTWSLRVRSTQLDRNVQDSYNVTVYAIDNGQPRNTGSTTVKVTITDINNKPPVLDEERSDTTISIFENVTIGSLIGTVVATDLDEDFNLTYSITKVACIDENEFPVESESCEDWFLIETISQEGIISVTAELDRETVEQVTLTVQVEDFNAEGSEKQTDSITVEIQILDFNDNPPEFDEQKPTFTVIEEVANGTSIGQLSASDKDIPSDTGITFYTSNHFVDITPQGELSVRNRINRERQPGDSFEAVIFATDNGDPALDSNVTVIFTVADTNDNSPVFVNASYVCEVQEELEAGTVVCNITATDDDIGENAGLLYSVNPGDSFVVGSNTGEITTIKRFNREVRDSFQFKLKAKDNAGDLSREAEVDVIVNILDIDDNDPNYQGFSEQNMEIVEENEIGKSVGIVEEAYDADTEEFRENYYFLVYESESDTRDVFSLNKTSRELTAAQELDREQSSSYTLHVLTTNEETIENDTYTTGMEVFVLTVKIAVADINDNNPAFTQKTYTTDMQWDTQPSDTDVIVSVKANDPDEGNNALLIYSIVQQRFINSAEQSRIVTLFKIEETNGEGYIYLSATPNLGQEDREGGQYQLDLVVEDQGNQKLSDTATVFVKIFDVTETVKVESLHSVEYLDENRDQLELDLEAALDADVVIDAITPHGGAQAQARAEIGPQSDIYFHATVWNESTVVPADEIGTSLDSAENNELRATWSIVGIEDGQPATETENEPASLKLVLAIACVLIVLILIVYTIAFVCMRNSYKTKINSSKATEEAARQTLHSYNAANGGDLNIPGTNVNAAGESALYVENQKGNIDMEEFRVYQEIADGDSNSIDDNAVDSQDSVISEDQMDMTGNELDDLDIDHDWNNENSAENLAAALNASKKRGGDENIILMFDNPGMEHGDTAM